MLIKNKPTTSSRRHRIEVDRSGLFHGEPEKSLLMPGHKKRQGRGFQGHITVRHRGGGVKKRMRVIDWKRDKFGVPGKVDRIEYDPMRGAHLALVIYADGDKRYMIAPDTLKIGDAVMSGEKAEVRIGNALPLKLIPVGTPIHNLELRKGRGAQMVRGAGTAAYIQSKEETMITVQMPSKEVRLVPADCLATIGQVGNSDWKNRKLGKAGRKRLMGIRPTVRGSAMHPNNHPHGGGEGRTGVGLKYPKTPWGKHALGTKTRKKSKYTNKYIIKDRRSK